MVDPKKYRTPGKKRPRSHGEGTFFQRADGMWVGRVELEPGLDGRRRRSLPVYAKDKNACKEKLDKLKKDLAEGIEQAPQQKRPVKDRIELWAQTQKAEWAPNYFKGVRAAINQQIVPSIGGVDVKLLRTEHIQFMIDWVTDQTKTETVVNDNGAREEREVPKWASRTRQIAYDKVRQWLDWEMHQRPRLVRENVAALVKRPSAISQVRESHTLEEAREVLARALDAADPYVSLWAARYLTGMRQGELMGLRRDRIDWGALTLDVSWQLQELPLKPGMKYSDDPGRFDAPDTYEIEPLYLARALTRPKGRKVRVNTMPPEFAIMLKTYIENTPGNEFGLVWVNAEGKPFVDKEERALWRAAQERAGVRVIDGHGTRHTANSLIPVDEVHRMKFLGHSTAAANRLYLHEDLEKLREGQNALAGMLLPEKLAPRA